MNEVIGILGGGQLGKMLFQAATKLGLKLRFMDGMTQGPVSSVTSAYTIGNINDSEDVVRFGKEADVVSIEIERVHVDGLRELVKMGKKVFPQPDIIACIQDKGLQKEFYTEQGLPTSKYTIVQSLNELKEMVENRSIQFPFVQKLCRDGYDGRGVMVHTNLESISNGFVSPSVIEAKVDIEKELAVVTCTDQDGNVAIYDPVEMVFHPEANILLYQLAPARVDHEVVEKAKKLALDTSRAFGIVGLLAIEMFYTTDGELLINEVAPRPHNSGHHTIEACYTSQYENHLRAIASLPLGAANTHSKSLLMNILGDEGYSGTVSYEGLNEVLALPGINVHLYGKTETRPFRKMGHINIIGDNFDRMIQYYEFINRTLHVISK